MCYTDRGGRRHDIGSRAGTTQPCGRRRSRAGRPWAGKRGELPIPRTEPDRFVTSGAYATTLCRQSSAGLLAGTGVRQRGGRSGDARRDRRVYTMPTAAIGPSPGLGGRLLPRRSPHPVAVPGWAGDSWPSSLRSRWVVMSSSNRPYIFLSGQSRDYADPNSGSYSSNGHLVTARPGPSREPLAFFPAHCP